MCALLCGVEGWENKSGNTYLQMHNLTVDAHYSTETLVALARFRAPTIRHRHAYEARCAHSARRLGA